MDNIKEVRSLNNIVDVISSYIPLTRKGKNYFGVCPFHDDNNPSMSISEEKQIYKCFSCGASGNVFNFVMDYEHVDFKEAYNILAKRAGIKTINITNTSNNKYSKYYDIYDLTVKFYQNNLSSEKGIKAKEYLSSRFIDEDIIKEFKIGLALDDATSLTDLLLKKDYNIKDLNDIGLSISDKDLFNNRIMFSLFDTSGKVVGFSGRIFNDNSRAKYVNTKETPIFRKRELLYNYHLAKDEARINKSLIIVEGFMDVIRLYSVGIKNVVAIMGTALSKEQINLIKRLTKNIYLCLDADDAGLMAMYNIGNSLDSDFNLNIVTLKDNLDPDEYILKYGKTSFLQEIESAISFSDFKINYLRRGKDFTSVADEALYINEVIDTLAKEKDEIKKELILKKLTQEFTIDVEILRKKLQNIEKYSKIETFTKKPAISSKLDKYQKATHAIIYCMLESYDAVLLYKNKLNYLPYQEARYLANEIIHYYNENKEFILADFLTTLEGKEELKSLIMEILKLDLEEIDKEVVEAYIKVIKEYNRNQELNRLKEELKNEFNEDKKALIAEKIRQVKLGS